MHKSPYFWNVIAMTCLVFSQSLLLLGGVQAGPRALHATLLGVGLVLGGFSCVQLLREHRKRSREGTGRRSETG